MLSSIAWSVNKRTSDKNTDQINAEHRSLTALQPNQDRRNPDFFFFSINRAATMHMRLSISRGQRRLQTISMWYTYRVTQWQRTLDNLGICIFFRKSFWKLRFGKTALFDTKHTFGVTLYDQGVAVLFPYLQSKRKKRKIVPKKIYTRKKRKEKKECSLKAFSIRSSTFTRYPPRGRSDYFSLRKKSQTNEMYNYVEKKEKKKKKREILLYRRVCAQNSMNTLRPTCQWTR